MRYNYICTYCIAKLLGIHTVAFLSEKFVKGCYAVSVSGDLPPDILDELRERGVIYRSRDTSDR